MWKYNHTQEKRIDLRCDENFREAAPEEFYISIRALGNLIAIPVDSVQSVCIPCKIHGEIVADHWFSRGIQTKFTIPAEGNYELQINLNPHPYLNFGFFIQITPNSWLPNGIILHQAPNGELQRGAIIILQFITSNGYHGRPFFKIQPSPRVD